mmetsp:Transcript_33853/g.79309  ORF Transcript_33853/g.79309 Transcript_33853/m.79309 type:complete len:265 (+) Transcript_33853:500-1294(+)
MFATSLLRLKRLCQRMPARRAARKRPRSPLSLVSSRRAGPRSPRSSIRCSTTLLREARPCPPRFGWSPLTTPQPLARRLLDCALITSHQSLRGATLTDTLPGRTLLQSARTSATPARAALCPLPLSTSSPRSLPRPRQLLRPRQRPLAMPPQSRLLRPSSPRSSAQRWRSTRRGECSRMRRAASCASRFSGARTAASLCARTRPVPPPPAAPGSPLLPTRGRQSGGQGSLASARAPSAANAQTMTMVRRVRAGSGRRGRGRGAP